VARAARADHLHRDSGGATLTAWPQRRTPLLGPFGVRVLFWLLVELWVLNLADLLLTRYSLWLGFAKESNGVMDYFFRAGTVPTVAFKIGIVTVGALVLWRLHRYRTALIATALLTAVFAAVVVYQALWVLSF
jgi:hypothetical protein